LNLLFNSDNPDRPKEGWVSRLGERIKILEALVNERSIERGFETDFPLDGLLRKVG
jgi:hypothetical protein